MTSPDPPVGEAELTAYVDGRLAPEQHAAVERYLRADPAAAQRVASDIAHRNALREAFANPPAQPLPPGLILSTLVEQRLRRHPMPWGLAAAVVLSLGIGAFGGWLLFAPPTPDRPALAMSLLQRQAMSSHAVYGADRGHPIEVAGSERDHLAQWLSNRLNRVATPPDLSGFGYTLIGGRLLATEQGGPAALFMYEDHQGARISLLMRPMAQDLHVPIVDWGRGDVSGCAWIEKGMGFALLGAVSDDQLDRIARQISEQRG